LNYDLELHQSFFPFPTGCGWKSGTRAILAAWVSYATDAGPEGSLGCLASEGMAGLAG
jgi:hypothetical protein